MYLFITRTTVGCWHIEYLQPDVHNLLKNIYNFRFMCSIIIIWYDILSIVNPVSKQPQSIQIDLQIIVKNISETIEFIKKYRRKGFSKVKLIATEIYS